MGKYSDIVSMWQKRNIDSADKLEAALSNFRIVFAYHSGVIENPEITYHNTREIFENGKIINFTGDLRTVFEMENQKKCYEFLVSSIIEKEKITPLFIKKIHKKLTQRTYDEHKWNQGERPGEYKRHDCVVADNQGALPEEAALEVDELCRELLEVNEKGENIIRAAAYLHCKFENIHPFADGNGRVGRTLMNYFLMTHDHPPLVVYYETKDKYYSALGHYDKTGQIDEFTAYMKECIGRTWELKRAPENHLENFMI